MRLVFIRHGEPNYELDCLTEKGKLQAQAAAERLKNENIDVIYASTMGRATETASYTAKMLNKAIIPLEFIREARCINSSAPNQKYAGNTESIARVLVEENGDLMNENWEESIYYNQTYLPQSAPVVTDGIDKFLFDLGYHHQGLYYRPVRENNNTVAIFCHANSSRLAITQILGLPFPYMSAISQPRFTAISVLDFATDVNKLIMPKIEILNDSRHIDNI